MKNLILIVCVLFFANRNFYAQKKTVKKPLKKVKSIPLPPEKAPEIRMATIEPSGDELGYPTPASPSPRMTKFENEKFCTDCDTLVLQAGKPQIVVYNTRWMVASDERSYLPQPTKKDVEEESFAMKGAMKREWDELHKNYPEKEMTYHYVVRNTFIKTPNAAQENVNLLNRQLVHKGFMYWSGKSSDKILNSNKMVFSTEKISKLRADKKVSSYYSSFKQDSLAIVNWQKTLNPDANLKTNMNTFLLEEILRDEILPIQFLELKNVKKIFVDSRDDKNFSFLFNTKGQVTEYNEGNNEKYVVSYKDDLPTTISKNGKINNHLYFQDNNVINKNSYSLNIYRLEGKLFFKTQQYYTEPKDYENLEIRSPVQYQISTENEKSCENMLRTDSSTRYTYCYSNNQWKLPLTTIKNYENFDDITTYNFNENNELIIESDNSYKAEKLVYLIENGILKNIKYCKKLSGEAYRELLSVPVKYEFYK